MHRTLRKGVCFVLISTWIVFIGGRVSAGEKPTAATYAGFAGLSYGSKSFSAFPGAPRIDSLSIIGIWQPPPKPGSEDVIRGLGFRADLGIFNEGDVFEESGFEAMFADGLLGYEIGRAGKFSVFAGIGLGYYSWDSNGPLKPEPVFPILWDLNATVHLGSRALFTLGVRGDEGDEPKVEQWAGGGSIDLSGKRIYGAIALAY